MVNETNYGKQDEPGGFKKSKFDILMEPLDKKIEQLKVMVCRLDDKLIPVCAPKEPPKVKEGKDAPPSSSQIEDYILNVSYVLESLTIRIQDLCDRLVI